MKIGSFYLTLSSNHYAWVGEIELLEPENLAYNTPINLTLVVNGQPLSFSLLVDDKSTAKKFASQRQSVKVIGVSANYASPRAAKFKDGSNSQTLAANLATSLIAGFNWNNFVNWQVKASSLDFSDKTAFELLNELVTAAGGFIQVEPSGLLSANRLFKRSVPELKQGSITPETVDVVLNEWEVLDLSEQGLTGEGYNRVTLLSQVSENELSLEIDSRPDGYNQGKTEINAGDSKNILVFSNAENPNDLKVEITAGSITPLTSGTYPVSGFYDVVEQLSFVQSESSALSRANAQNVHFSFIGTQPKNLTPALDSIAKNLVFTEPVTCLLEVRYQVRYWVYQAFFPSELNGKSQFSSLIAVSYKNEAGILASEQRGSGDKSLEDVSEPLITSEIAPLKARSLLDENERLMKLKVLCLYKQGMKPSALIGFFRHDGSRALWVVDAIELRREASGKLTASLDVFVLQ